jgi:hydroxypyruvate isomerase
MLAGRALASRVAAAPPQAKATRLPLSITWGMFGRTPVPDAFKLLQKHDFDAFEMFDWRRADLLDAIVAEMKNYKFECATLVANRGVTAPGCGLVNPAERDSFLKEVNLAIEAAKKVNCKRLVVLTGNELPGVSRETQMQSCVDGLKAAAPILERSGITVVIEILNTYVNHAGYFLYYVKDGVQMVDRVGSPNVKLLFDIYHTQIMEGNLVSNITKNVTRIGHIHIGDNPGRHQPGTGEINFRNIYKAILATDYKGYAALEYSPTVPLDEDMAAQRKLSLFS